MHYPLCIDSREISSLAYVAGRYWGPNPMSEVKRAKAKAEKQRKKIAKRQGRH